MMANDASYRGVLGQIILPAPPAAYVVQIGHAGPGTDSQYALPTQTSGLISWQTAKAGRAYRGRTYLPFPSIVEDAAGEVPTTSYITKGQTLAAALLGLTSIVVGSRSATVQLSLLHRKGLLKNTVTPITAFTMGGRWATTRRRGAFGRPNLAPTGM